MPTTFTNNWKNILDKLQNVLRTEFKNTLPVYVGEVNEKAGSQYLRIDPVGSELVEYNSLSESREYSINIFMYFADKSESRTRLDAILRLVSRIESLIVDNVNMTFTNENSVSEQAYNCRVESMEMNAGEDEDIYIVQWDWKCLHRTNLV